jgi:hypothetical protein
MLKGVFGYHRQLPTSTELFWVHQLPTNFMIILQILKLKHPQHHQSVLEARQEEKIWQRENRRDGDEEITLGLSCTLFWSFSRVGGFVEHRDKASVLRGEGGRYETSKTMVKILGRA